MVETSTCRRMISNVSGTPAKPVQPSDAIVSRTIRGNAKRSSRNTEPPAKQVGLEDAPPVAVVERQDHQARSSPVRPRYCDDRARVRIHVSERLDDARAASWCCRRCTGPARASRPTAWGSGPAERARRRVDPAVLEEQRRRDMAERLQERRIERRLVDSPDVVDGTALEDRAPRANIAARHDEPRMRPFATMSPRTSALHSRFTSTDVAPSAFTASAATTVAGVLGSASSTRLPGPTPRAAKWSARARTRAARSPYVSRAVGVASAGALGDRSAWKKSQSGAKALVGSACSVEPLPGDALPSIPKAHPSCRWTCRRLRTAARHSTGGASPNMHAFGLEPRAMFSRNVLRIDPGQVVKEIEGTIREVVLGDLRRRGAVVGISGGIDSAVVATLCAHALGAERVVGLLMPDRDSSE